MPLSNCLLDLFSMQEKIILVFTHTLAHAILTFLGGIKQGLTQEKQQFVAVLIFDVF